MDTMGRMHSDAQFAGSSSVPAHVEMMGFLGVGNNPMVGCTVACAVDVATACHYNWNGTQVLHKIASLCGQFFVCRMMASRAKSLFLSQVE